MNPLCSITSFFVVTAFVLSTQTAFAEEPPATAPTSDVASSDLRLGAALGGYGSNAGNGAVIGVSGLLRLDVIEAGFQLQAGTGLGSYSFTSASGLLGLGLTPARDWRIDLLGEVGATHYDNFGTTGGWFGDPGASATLPYGGLHISVSHRINGWDVGGSADLASDLAREDVHYTYTGGSWLGPSYQESSSKRVGTDRLAVMLTLGHTFDL